MLLTEITFDDRIRLSQLHNERLRSFFTQSLLHCVFRRGRHKTLIIHCPEAWMVDRLLPDLEELCNRAWLILGVEAIALYFVQEEICCVEHCRVPSATCADSRRIKLIPNSSFRGRHRVLKHRYLSKIAMTVAFN
jgi:hypothetical protein